MKCMLYAGIGERVGHSPHGECGLKCTDADQRWQALVSLPAWGVRVEIEPYAALR